MGKGKSEANRSQGPLGSKGKKGRRQRQKAKGKKAKGRGAKRSRMSEPLARGRATGKQTLESVELKRIAIDISLVFYKMSHFRVNE
jgi:hypothetical protein